jgi:hypothetical protein
VYRLPPKVSCSSARLQLIPKRPPASGEPRPGRVGEDCVVEVRHRYLVEPCPCGSTVAAQQAEQPRQHERGTDYRSVAGGEEVLRARVTSKVVKAARAEVADNLLEPRPPKVCGAVELGRRAEVGKHGVQQLSRIHAAGA